MHKYLMSTEEACDHLRIGEDMGYGPTTIHYKALTDLLAAHAEIAALKKRVEHDDEADLQTIAQRDQYEEFIAELATDLGCEEEWSGLHSHLNCIPEFTFAIEKKAKEQDEELARLRKWQEEAAEHLPFLRQLMNASEVDSDANIANITRLIEEAKS